MHVLPSNPTFENLLWRKDWERHWDIRQGHSPRRPQLKQWQQSERPSMGRRPNKNTSIVSPYSGIAHSFEKDNMEINLLICKDTINNNPGGWKKVINSGDHCFPHTQNVLIMYTQMCILTSASLERLKKSYIKKLNIYGRETEGEKWLDFLMTISLCFYMNLYIYNQRKNKKTRRGSWVNNHKLFLGTEGDGTMISQKHWWANLDSKGVFGSDKKWSSPELEACTK